VFKLSKPHIGMDNCPDCGKLIDQETKLSILVSVRVGYTKYVPV